MFIEDSLCAQHCKEHLLHSFIDSANVSLPVHHGLHLYIRNLRYRAGESVLPRSWLVIGSVQN